MICLKCGKNTLFDFFNCPSCGYDMYEHINTEKNKNDNSLNNEISLDKGAAGTAHKPRGADAYPLGSMNSKSLQLAAAVFKCCRCNAVAGVIRLYQVGSRLKIERVCFTSTLTIKVEPVEAESVRAAIESANAAEVYALDFELTPFFCPVCSAVYCGKHWSAWDVFDDDGWHDSIHGRCPEGHERMLED